MSNGACTFAGNGDPVAGLRAMGTYIDLVAAQYDVGVFLNMDHQTDHDVIETQIDLGIPSSIMVDASHESFERNVERSRAVVEAADADILVEAELGRIKGVEDETVSHEAFYTDPEELLAADPPTGGRCGPVGRSPVAGALSPRPGPHPATAQEGPRLSRGAANLHTRGASAGLLFLNWYHVT